MGRRQGADGATLSPSLRREAGLEARLSDVREVRYTLISSQALGGGHLVFALGFALAAVWPLAAINVCSMLAFAAAYRMASTGRIGAAKIVCAIEIVVHAVVATVWIGWETGFHLYLLLLAPAVYADYRLRPARKLTLTLALMAGYVAIDALLRPRAPLVMLPALAVDVFRWLNLASTVFWLAYEMRRYAMTASDSERSLSKLATRDPLTGLGNRRQLLLLTRGGSGAERRAFSVVVADVDHFKQVNDRHGHAAGDAVLQALADAFVAATRSGDHALRLGGEEFLLLLPDTPLDVATAVAERLAVTVRGRHIPALDGSVTCTFGVATRQPDESFDDCLRRADAALYAGKRDGRDRVVVAPVAG